MNWDHSIHSFTDPNVEPQTPTRTPNTGAVDESAFQTPKFESSFYDPRITWNTADPYASSPDVSKNFHRYDQTPNQRLRNAVDDLTSASKVIEEAGEALEPDLVSTNHASDQVFSSAKRSSAASIQTPPPTSTVRRKNQDRSSVSFNLSTPIQPNQPPETPSRMVGFSPGMFGLQESPDLFNFSENGINTSPFLSRQLPWMHGVESTDTSMQIQNTYGDPFVDADQPMPNFDPNSIGQASVGVPPLPTISNSMAFDARTTSQASCEMETEQTTFHNAIATSPRAPPPAPEDPSLFLSSPARRFGHSEPTFSPPLPPRIETRQPYHHQMETSEREQRALEIKKLQRSKSSSRRQKVMRVESASHIPQTIPTKPIVKRSVSHSGAPPISSTRHQRQSSFSSNGPVLGGGGVRKTPSKGRTSPLKNQISPFAQPSSTSLPAPMESLILKISKDGLATTEMKLVSDSPTRLPTHIRTTVSGESSTEIESDSSDDDPIYSAVHSQAPSFAFPGRTPRKPDFVRAQTCSRPQSKSSGYSSTAASTHSGRLSPWAGPTQPPTFSQQDNRSPKKLSTISSRSHSRDNSMTDSDATLDEDGSGDAQHALREVLRSRKRQTQQSIGMKPPTPSTVRRTTSLRSSPPPYNNRVQSIGASSPAITESVPRTPGAGHQSNPSTGTRCVCKSMNNGGHLMIQCESCSHWLHTKCVGLRRQRLPPVYICLYCTQTPTDRPDRNPSALNSLANSSPLARKSFGGR